MAFQYEEPFDLQKIQKELGITSPRIQYCGLTESDLRKIYDNYTGYIPKLQEVRADILSILNDKLADKVHSVRGRVKDPNHLIEKIIRNKTDKPKKYEELNIDNYNKIITDLIGFRIIILDKKDWREVHNTLLQVFQNLPDRYAVEEGDIIKNFDKYEAETKKNNKKKTLEMSYHAERPVAYLTSIDDRELYQDPYLRVDSSRSHYRSIHYIIRYGSFYFEIQVRTLFEEGWLEFDHRIKYPYDQNNRKKQEFLAVLNSLATAADRHIAFYDEELFRNVQGEPLDDVCEDSSTTVTADADLEEQTLKNKILSNFSGR